MARDDLSAGSDGASGSDVGRLQAILETSHDGVVVHDAGGLIVAWNASALRILGLSAEQMLGRTPMDPGWRTVHEDGSHFSGDAHPAAVTLATGQAVSDVLMGVYKPDGSQTWILINSGPLHSSDGVQVVSSFSDVTQQRAVERNLELLAEKTAELQRSEEHFRLLAENSADVVAQVTHGWVITWISPTAQAVLGWSPEELVGHRVADLTHPDDRTLGLQWQEEMRKGAANRLVELRVLTASGTYRWMSMRTSPTPSANHRVMAMRDVQDEVLARQALANSQRRYLMLAENASDIVWQIDADLAMQWVAPSIESVLGWAPSEMLGQSTLDLVHPEDVPAFNRWRITLFSGGKVPQLEVRLRNSEGDYRWLSMHSRPMSEPGRSVEGAVVGLRDVHEQVLGRERLARSETMFRLAMEGAPQGMAVVGLHGKFLRFNGALCDLTGRDADWLADHAETDLLHPGDVAADQAVRDRLLADQAEYDVRETRLVTADDRVLWVQHSIALVRDEHGMPLFYVSQFQDITGTRATQQELRYRAEHDLLTGLVNRGVLQARIVSVLSEEAGREGVPALLFCDLDRFKGINDVHGHASGDYVLRLTAERIASVLRPGDEVARLGGDEFVVLLPEVSDDEEALAIAERIREVVGQPFPLGKVKMSITLSIGVAFATPGIEARVLLHSADAALYQAKYSGRDRVWVSDGSDEFDGGFQ